MVNDPSNSHKAIGGDIERSQEPLAASDGHPQSDEARANDELDHTLEVDTGYFEDFFRRGQTCISSAGRLTPI